MIDPVDTSPEITGIALNEWKFTADNKQFKGIVNIAYFHSGSGLFLECIAGPASDTSLFLLIGFPTGEIAKGYYSTAMLPNNSLFYMSDTNTTGIFDGNPNTTHYGVVTFQIVNYDPATNQVKGRFSGKVKNKNLTTSTITDGVFWALVN